MLHHYILSLKLITVDSDQVNYKRLNNDTEILTNTILLLFLFYALLANKCID